MTKVSMVVIQRTILPGTISGGMKKDSQDMKTNNPDGIYVKIR